MNNLKMILSDGSEIVLAEFTIPMHAVALCETREEAIDNWLLLTPESLLSVQVIQDENVILSFQNVNVVGGSKRI